VHRNEIREGCLQTSQTGLPAMRGAVVHNPEYPPGAAIKGPATDRLRLNHHPHLDSTIDYCAIDLSGLRQRQDATKRCLWRFGFVNKLYRTAIIRWPQK
jgi:hypothetical protein